MKPSIVTLLAAMSLLAGVLRVHAQGNAFTYQGRLMDNGNAYTGNAEIQATLWDAASGGGQIAVNVPAQVIVAVTNGLFVLPLDFGANFPGAERWLQLAVRTTVAPFTTLSPRQPLTATPYAITASNLTGTLPAAQLSGTIASSNLSGAYGSALTMTNPANVFGGSFQGNGVGVTNVNAATLGGLSSANFWQLGGNAGANPTNGNFLGTTDNLPLELKVNGTRVMRLERYPDATIFDHVIPNLVGGYESNRVADGIGGATIAGGGGPEWFGVAPPHTVSGQFGTIGGGVGNIVQGSVSVIAGGERGFIGSNAYNAVIAGGAWNSINAADASIGGGRNNSIQTNAYSGIIAGGSGNTIHPNVEYSIIGGGLQNQIHPNANYSTLAGGYFNSIQSNAAYASLGGGGGNFIRINAVYATIPGGYANSAASYAFAAGRRAKANHTGAFVWADSTDQDFASTANNQFLVRAAGGVGIGIASPGAALDVRTTSGTGNAIRFGFHTGGEGNLIAGPSRVGIATGDMVERISIPQSTGNVGLGITTPSQKLHVIGNILATGSITPNSDVNAKTDFAPVEVAEILERVLTLPVQRWRFKTEPDDVKHIGPMAQDFRAAFGLGEIPTAIATVDADGVALAAIQGLNAKVEIEMQKAESLAQRLEQKEIEMGELKEELAEIKRLLVKLARNEN